MKTNSVYANEIYQGIGYDELVTYAVLNILSSGREATYENIVAEVFTLFPKRFALRGYPQWPDSAVVSKSWWRCRTDKHYLEGSVKAGFRLTPKGLKMANDVAQKLGSVVSTAPNGIVLTEVRTKAGRLLRAVEKSKAFAQFKQTGDLDGLKDYELTDMLLCMPDSEIRVVKHNLEQFNQAAELYSREDIKELLSLVKSRLLASHPALEK